MSCRNADGTVLDATGAATAFKIVPGGWGVGTLTLQGAGATDEGVITSTLAFEYMLPTDYTAGTDVEVNVAAKYSFDAGGGPAHTIDCEAYELTDAGTVGADLNDDAVENLTTSYADTAGFTIDGSGLVAGDRLSILLQTVITAAPGGPELDRAHIGSIEVQADGQF